MWGFFRKREKEPDFKGEIVEEAVPMSTLIRWYCYDLGIDDVNSLAKQFGLFPVSEEGEEFEYEASDKRMDNIYPLLPFLDMMAKINAKAVHTIQFEDLGPEEKANIEGLDTEVMEIIYSQISFAALTAAFSAALELGLVSRNYGTMTIGQPDVEELDEQ